jgi:glycosyltransferase involved in cell wall biosynthesis
MDSDQRCALVHDYLLVNRGAERTFEVIAGCWPEAPIYTLLYDEAATERRYANRQVRTSHLQRLRVRQSSFRQLLPVYPLAVRTLRPQARLVVSSSSAFAHGVRTTPGAVHVCYCHSPFRYAWHDRGRVLHVSPRWGRAPLEALLAGVRLADRAAAARVDHFIANSEITRERIGRFYGRDAIVVHPPVDVDRFSPGEAEDWFLVVGELVNHKRVANALEAAERTSQSIKVVGAGPDRAALETRYGGRPGVEFMGRVDDATLADVYARARAVVVPNVEEFGIVAVEAQAAGRPVISVDAGGARETVLPGETGVLVPPDDVGALAEAMRYTDFGRFSTRRIVTHARPFGPERFRTRLCDEVRRLTNLDDLVASPTIRTRRFDGSRPAAASTADTLRTH